MTIEIIKLLSILVVGAHIHLNLLFFQYRFRDLSHSLLYAILAIGFIGLCVAYLALYSATIAQIAFIISLVISTYQTYRLFKSEAPHFKSKTPHFNALYQHWWIAFICILTVTFWGQPDFSPKYVNNVWLLKLPIDNEISLMFAKSMLSGHELFAFGDWLGSDRPPLMSGLFLYFRLPFININENYQLVGTILQCLVVPISIVMLRQMLTIKTLPSIKLGKWKLSVEALLLLLILQAPIFIFNVTFLWPKILSVVFSLVFLILHINNTSSRAISKSTGNIFSAITIGLAAALSMLAHGGAVFFLIAAALYSIVARATGRLSYMVFSIGTFLTVYAPWVFYQKFVQPPGDRLLKWHLAGVIPVTDESFNTVLHNAYQGVTPLTIFKRVLSQFETHFLWPLKGIPYVDSFYWSVFTIGFLGVIIYGISALGLLKKNTRPYTAIAILSFLIWSIMMFNGGPVHAGVYTMYFLILIVFCALFSQSTIRLYFLVGFSVLSLGLTVHEFRNYKIESNNLQRAVENDALNCEIDANLIKNTIILTTCQPGSAIDFLPLKREALLQNEGFTGLDWERDLIGGWETFGTGSIGEAAKGSIKVRAQPGEMLFFRTGPVSNKQIVKVISDETIIHESILPITNQWSALVVKGDLSSTDTPQDLILEFSDEGSDWGEWSAIMLNWASD